MRDLSKNKNIEHLKTTIMPFECVLDDKMEHYRCRTKNGDWYVTITVEYNERYQCWFERLVMSDWNKKTKRVPRWEHIVAVKREFFKPTEECIQFIPRDDEYINLKENCMHIFHPLMGFDPKSLNR